MENSEKANGSQLFMEEQGVQLSFQIAGERYRGYCPRNAKHFTITNEQGKEIFVSVRDITGDEETKEQVSGVDCPQRYPHLHFPIGVIKSGTQEFTLFSQQDGSQQEELETVLFGKNMSLLQRLMLSLSLAAAVSELEAVFDEISVKQLRMDALFADTRNCVVSIECGKLTESRTEDENIAEYQKMAKLGLMPPEWYADTDMDPASVKSLRHFLAVCIFRLLCSEDPFDGAHTLQAYPYRGSESLAMIYGRDAKYILNKNPDNPNRANHYIGMRAYAIFNAICPRLKQLFEDAFIYGIQYPSQRPSARAWVENQKKMVSWFMVSGKEWRIADLKDGSGTFEGVNYLMIDNGIIVPLIHEKPLYQFMFEPPEAPVNEKVVGKVYKEGFGTKLIFSDEKEKSITLYLGEKNKLLGNAKGLVTDAPWERT